MRFPSFSRTKFLLSVAACVYFWGDAIGVGMYLYTHILQSSTIVQSAKCMYIIYYAYIYMYTYM